MIEGQEGFIWPMRNLGDQTIWALKVLKPAYCSERQVGVAAALLAYRNVPGFILSQRICLTRSFAAELLAQFPALEYALLMPWLPWKTWAGLMRSPEISVGYTRKHALRLALATAHSLVELERRGYAHTDIAGSNVMYMQDFAQIELLDLEGLYAPELHAPEKVSYGSPGYQHRRLGRAGQWSPYGDRFAGAILLTEMLTWWHPLIRGQTSPDASTLFTSEDFARLEGPRIQTVRDILWSLDSQGGLLKLFDQTWHAASLKACPDLQAWLLSLRQLAMYSPQTPSPATPVTNTSISMLPTTSLSLDV